MPEKKLRKSMSEYGIINTNIYTTNNAILSTNNVNLNTNNQPIYPDIIKTEHRVKPHNKLNPTNSTNPTYNQVTTSNIIESSSQVTHPKPLNKINSVSKLISNITIEPNLANNDIDLFKEINDNFKSINLNWFIILK